MKTSYLKQFFAVLFVGTTLVSCSQEYSGNSTSDTIAQETNESTSPFEKRAAEFEQQKSKAKSFIEKHTEYNQDVVFLLDMRLPSENFRFFIHDFKQDSITNRALVAHGSGSGIDDSLIFSNIPESYQSSLGYYKVGAKYTGKFGESYKLHGLDKTNSNAYKRYIVLHPYSCVPDEEQEYPICLSLGCPMVSDNFIQILYKIIDNSKKPILMVMYY